MNKIYSNVMLGLETMAVSPDAAIVDIGLVLFDISSGTIGPTWTAAINLESAVAAGGRLDADTVLWWMQQEKAARMRIARGGGLFCAVALRELAGWMDQHTHDAQVWSNGANFDGVILRQAYARTGLTCPWNWRNERCYRTVAKLHPHIPIERTGTQHIALDDALDQARHLIKMLAPRLEVQ